MQTLDAFERIMDERDRDLFCWFTGEVARAEDIDKPMFDAILSCPLRSEQIPVADRCLMLFQQNLVQR